MGQGISGSLRAICALVALAIAAAGASAPVRAQDAAAATATAAKHSAKTVAKKKHEPTAKTAAAAATPAIVAPAEEAGPMQSILGALHLAPEPSPVPDFVRDSRPKQLDYLPITSRGDEPDRPILSPDEIRRHEEELQGLRARHDKLAARAPAPAAKSAAPDPVAKKAKVVAPCLLTCTIKNRPDSMK